MNQQEQKQASKIAHLSREVQFLLRLGVLFGEVLHLQDLNNTLLTRNAAGFLRRKPVVGNPFADHPDLKGEDIPKFITQVLFELMELRCSSVIEVSEYAKNAKLTHLREWLAAEALALDVFTYSAPCYWLLIGTSMRADSQVWPQDDEKDSN
jgi:hypothetical protein